ncbi:MAG TPA: DedA family protein [Solirubrobacteraceae bacterium]|jgi:membrane protein DedA with SNARE-associated domain|nr:DedA family protein [Solirubrobacteraceae bacterium]
MLASLIDVNHLVEVSGYPILFLLVMAESGGVPVPGETAVIVGGVLSSQGKLEIGAVIAVAALAAIVGDNIGYQIGRKGGRWLLQRPGPFLRQRQTVLEMGEPFFEHHGPKAVFFGRFILGLRTWASWLAGANHMRWRTFFLWNALGGICWATGVGLVAYFVGHSASNAITTFGIYGLVAVVLAMGGALVLHRRHRRRSRTGAAPDQGSRQPPPEGAMRSHNSASAPSSASENRERNCSRTTAR